MTQRYGDKPGQEKPAFDRTGFVPVIVRLDSGIVASQREGGHDEAVFIHHAVAPSEREVLGEEREFRELVRGNQLVEVGHFPPVACSGGGLLDHLLELAGLDHVVG